MLYRIVVALVAVALFVVAYIAASVVAWVVEGLSGLDHASSAGIATGLFLGQLFSLVTAILAAVATVRVGVALRRRFARDRADRR